MNRIKILLIIIFGLFLLTGCDNNTAIAAEDFVDYMEQNEYQTTNVKSQFSNYPQIKNVFIAQNNDMTYQIEYYEFTNDDYAKRFFLANRNIFKETKEKIKARTQDDKDNYQKYTQTTDKAYSLIVRLDNTAIYANVKPEYEEEVDNIIFYLGY